MNIKKLFATLAGVSLFAQTVVPFGALAATYSQELQDAYNWAYGKSITTKATIDDANMYGAITRAELAKMLANWAKDRGQTPDTSKSCTFSDTASVQGDLAVAIVESCQLGLMGQLSNGNTSFRPYDTITRAEFGTALSRALWGDKYEGGTPYYARHLDALKAAGIMTQIANAESTKEIRGYVMLMLMRSENVAPAVDCEDAMVKAACLIDDASCPAACKEVEEPTVVKAGDLSVTAKAAELRKAIVSVSGAVSDLDTLTFKSSEKVTISKVILERYGYSSEADVDAVWLEDQDGNVIADEKSLSKDKVTLSIKKDYRDTDGTLKATVVAKLTGNNVGGTIGFKVVDVESTAKNLNLDNYTPYTYDMVTYSGNTVTVDIKGSKKDYNYVDGESYEIARLKVKAGSSIIYVKGFTLTNSGNLDMSEFLDKLTVKVDGEDVKGLKYSVNKDDQIVISFDEMTIEMNKSALFVVSATLKDFDDYGDYVAYYLFKDSDINAVEKKTGARLTVNGEYKKANAISHAFNGGKIKLQNNKLGKLDASQGAEDVVVAEGNITITEPISKLGFTLNADGSGKNYVTAVRMFVDGEEFEAKKNGTAFSFSNVEIVKSGKIQFKIDIEDVIAAQGKVITFKENFNGDLFKDAKYDNSRETVKTGDVSGAISFSQVTIQPATATFKNSLSKAVEFMNQDTNEGVVFDGTYTAKKADINLNKFYMSGTDMNKVRITYNLFINDKEVASVDAYGSGQEEVFSDVKVKAGESVKVKVVAEVEAYGLTGSLTGFQVVLGGTDNFDKDVDPKAAKLVDMKIVEKGAVNLAAGSVSKTVLYKAKGKTLAQFTVAPADGASSVEIENISFSLTPSAGTITTDDISVMLGNEELEAESAFYYGDIKKTITEKTVVKVILDEEKTGTITLSGVTVNNKSLSKEYVTRFEEAVVSIATQTKMGGGSTKVVVAVEKDDEVEVRNLVVTAGTITGGLTDVDTNGYFELVNPDTSDKLVTKIEYDVVSSNYVAGSCSNGTDTTEAACIVDHPKGTWTVAGNCDDTTMTTEATCTGNWDHDSDTSTPEQARIWTDTSSCSNGTDTTEAACIVDHPKGTWTPAVGTSTHVEIEKGQYNDFFLVGDTYARAFGNNNN